MSSAPACCSFHSSEFNVTEYICHSELLLHERELEHLLTFPSVQWCYPLTLIYTLLSAHHKIQDNGLKVHISHITEIMVTDTKIKWQWRYFKKKKMFLSKYVIRILQLMKRGEVTGSEMMFLSLLTNQNWSWAYPSENAVFLKLWFEGRTQHVTHGGDAYFFLIHSKKQRKL